MLGYGTGIHAPGLENMQMAITAAHHLLLGHGLAIPRLRAHTRAQAQLGITLNLSPIYALDNDPITRQTMARSDVIQNRWMLDPLFHGTYPEELFSLLNLEAPPIEANDLALIATPIDFLGINYYSRTQARGETSTFGKDPSPSSASLSSTAMDWEIYPQGLTDLLVRIHQDYAPRMQLITESGAAFDDQWDGTDRVIDPQRLQYLREHIHATKQAIEQGVPVHGYFVWSLLDNFEWGQGYSKRFGIVYVDYATQRRIIKESGRWYANLLKAAKG
jgi:beta-glucosidase